MLVLGLATRLLVLSALPVMPGGDSYARLADPRVLVKAVWLPAYQSTLAALSFFTSEPSAFRVLTAVEGGLACAAGAWCARAWLGPAAGWVVGLGMSVSPVFVLPSVGLYQEPLFWAVSLAAVATARSRGGTAPATVALVALSCLCRYEGWALALAYAAFVRRPVALLPLLVPVGWMASQGGVSSAGTAPLRVDLSLARLGEHAALLWELDRRWGGAPLALLGGLGAALAVARRRATRPALWTAGFLLVSVLGLAWLSPYAPDTNPRQLHAPLLALLALGGWALDAHLAGATRRAQGLTTAFAALVVVVLPAVTVWPALLREQEDNEAAAVVAAGRWLRGLPEGPRPLVLDPGLRAFPEAPTLACEAVRAYARVPVRCDHEPSGVLDEGVELVVQAREVQPWRPVHVAFAAEQAAGGWALAALSPFAAWTRAPGRTRAPAREAEGWAGPACEPAVATALPAVAGGEREARRHALYANGTASSPPRATVRYTCGSAAPRPVARAPPSA